MRETERRAAAADARGERRGGIDLRAILHGGLRSFRKLPSGPVCGKMWIVGLIYGFGRGVFAKPSRRALLAVGSTADGGDHGTVVL